MKQDTQQRASSSAAVKPSALENTAQTAMPIIASARTGLASKDDALVRRPEAGYAGSVRDLIAYLTTTDITEAESNLATSVKREAGAEQSVVMINGKKVENLDDPALKYAVVKSHKLPTGTINYQELEIEVSSVQKGGAYQLRR